MNTTIFCAPIDAVSDADDVLCRIKRDIDAAVKARGYDSRIGIMLHANGTWSVSFTERSGSSLARLSTFGHESLVDALAALRARLDEIPAQWTAADVDRTLGIWA